jgi:hypothetical protein
MKLKMLRQHYTKRPRRNRQSSRADVWIPKTPFESEDEIRKAGFYSSKWHIYLCDFCYKLHITDKTKRVS